MTSGGRGLRERALAADAGFTVVEALIAAAILAIGALAVLGLVDTATRNDFRAEQSQVASDRLQQEMEAVKQIPYAQVALTHAPTHSSDAASPNFRVSGTQFNVNRGGTAQSWGLVYNGGHSSEAGGTVSGGTIDPGPTPFTSGSVSGNVYRYVVWEPEVSCSNCAHNTNSDLYGGQRVAWFKHVVVAIALNPTGSGGTRVYQELQGDVGNPDAGQDSGSCGTPPCTSSNNATPWTFWITDTPCNNSTRQPIAGDHLTHDTLGACSKGMTSGPPGDHGANAGAPDLMFTQGAPCAGTPPDCTTAQPLYDYATDVEPAQNPTEDRGLQEMLPTNVVNGGSCLTDLNALTTAGLTSLLTLGPDPEWYIHKWVSPQVSSSWDNIVLDGTGTLNLWTQSINGGTYPGRICVWLFTRHLSTGIPVDTFAVNTDSKDACDPTRVISANLTYFPCSYPTWKNGEWTEIHIPLNFAALTLPAGDRLGLAIGVERQGSGGGLQYMYDTPTYDSRLVVNTHSLLPF